MLNPISKKSKNLLLFLFFTFFLLTALGDGKRETYFHVLKGSLFNLISASQASSQKVVLTKAPLPTIPVRPPLPTTTPSPTPTPDHSVTPTLGLLANDYCLRVPVLYYHHIEPMVEARMEGHAVLTVDARIFEEQMTSLENKGYTTLSADKLIDSLLNQKKLPEKSAVVTLDDGYADMYFYAFPIALKHHIVLNLMIPTGLMGKPGYLTWDQLQEMVASGYVYAYNHTVSHYPLAFGTPGKIKEEVVRAREDLVNHLNIGSTIITYPYGSYDRIVVGILKENGFIGAFSTHSGTLECRSNIMGLNRLRIGNEPLAKYNL